MRVRCVFQVVKKCNTLPYFVPMSLSLKNYEHIRLGYETVSRFSAANRQNQKRLLC